MVVVIHTNLSLENQPRNAAWLAEGFAARGIEAEITADRKKAADIHIVQGPHYCLECWQPRASEARVLLLDRCFYWDAKDNVSLGWLNPDGSRDFRHKGKHGPKGKAPVIAPLKTYRGSCVVFGDYGRPGQKDINEARKVHPRVYWRPHPADRQPVKALILNGDLAGVWALCDTAIGHSSTVLVDAVLNGLHTTSTDPRHVIAGVEHDRERWAAQLTWCQWNCEELKRGDFVEHLL